MGAGTDRMEILVSSIIKFWSNNGWENTPMVSDTRASQAVISSKSSKSINAERAMSEIFQ
jgi:hypothetical protein